MLKFHNKVCDQLKASRKTRRNLLLGGADKSLRCIFSGWCCTTLSSALPKKASLQKSSIRAGSFYRFKKTPYMPVEFSAAAYRFGQQHGEEVYSRILSLHTGAASRPQRSKLLFEFTGLSGRIIGDLAPNPPVPPLPLPVLSSNWITDWRRYPRSLPANPAGVPLNASRKMDPFLVPELHRLPGGDGANPTSLAFLNVRRGVILGLPLRTGRPRSDEYQQPAGQLTICEWPGWRRCEEAWPAVSGRRSWCLPSHGGRAARQRRKD